MLVGVLGLGGFKAGGVAISVHVFGGEGVLIFSALWGLNKTITLSLSLFTPMQSRSLCAPLVPDIDHGGNLSRHMHTGEVGIVGQALAVVRSASLPSPGATCARTYGRIHVRA